MKLTLQAFGQPLRPQGSGVVHDDIPCFILDTR